jgi:hypothetical protein
MSPRVICKPRAILRPNPPAGRLTVGVFGTIHWQTAAAVSLEAAERSLAPGQEIVRRVGLRQLRTGDGELRAEWTATYQVAP